MQIALSNVSYSYPESTHSIIDNVTVTFPKGWNALLGDNGCGKTTLAKIAIGEIQPDSGSVSSNLYAAYCPQETDEAPEALLDFAGDYSKEAVELRAKLRLEDDMPWRYDQLSTGEKKKLQVAVALWQRPDVLVLDEPTNHLDADARAQLISVLEKFEGVGILISHDRTLLDALATRCISFGATGLEVRNGSFSDVQRQAALERASTASEREKAKRLQSRLETERNRRAHEAARADSKFSKRNISAKDHDAKTKIDMARVSGQDGAQGKLAKQMDSRLDSVKNRLDKAFVEKRYDGNFWFDSKPHPRKTLVTVPEGKIPCGPDSLEFPNLYIDNDDHIGITGPNGAGKTTFLSHIRKQISSDISVLDIPQELGPDVSRCTVDEVTRMNSAEKGSVLSVVAQLNSDPDHILEGAQTSPGELRKLIIAVGISRSPQLIIMDEPTNHLDLHSVQALEEALAAFPGALLLISHDDSFLHACTNRHWEVRDGVVSELFDQSEFAERN
ncbi:MAG: ATP-binding cassette domain-containing protein [Coriobacteriales bacterium]